jgi:hypothetical protein
MSFSSMFLVAVDKQLSEVATPYGPRSFALKFCFRIEFFDFHVLYIPSSL